MSTRAYAAMAAKEPLQPHDYEAPTLGAMDCQVAITHCGICHSDLHLIDNDWGVSRYPLIPGHEIVGKVTAIGSDVKQLKVGQRVGIGWLCRSCMQCEWCLQGDDNLCSKQQPTCIGHPGGFADTIQVDSRFAVPIPESLSSEQVAPLFCGGVTVYSPLRTHVTSPMRVGIIGIGGLGHMGLQFANAFGCEVTAFSTSAGKEAEAKRLGAHHFVVSSDNDAINKLRNSFDFILNTANAALPWTTYLELLRPKGKLCFVGVPTRNIEIPAMNLIALRKEICGSNIGNIPTIKEMLDFAARHKLGAQIEPFPMSKVNDALDKLRKNDVRYRAVLVNDF
ncbi:MAG: NAD(P)-dependent alcohol dehydrogenase [Coxiellaceae bacterium]|nr:MAG: NAD(P)-dependent alcohol dehydrogenase [Coxiellaceae bacterium]